MAIAPGVYVSITDQSEFLNAEPVTSCYLPFFADRGEANTLVSLNGNKTFDTHYKTSGTGLVKYRDFKEGYINMRRWLALSGSAYGMRLLPSNQFDIDIYYKDESGDSQTVGLAQSASYANIMMVIGKKTGSTAYSLDFINLDEIVSVKDKQDGTPNTNALYNALYATSGTGYQTGEYFPMFAIHAKALGEYYNNLSIDFGEVKNEIDVYEIRVRRTDDEGSESVEERFLVSFDMDKQDLTGESMYIEDVLRRYSNLVDCQVNEENILSFEEKLGLDSQEKIDGFYTYHDVASVIGDNGINSGSGKNYTGEISHVLPSAENLGKVFYIRNPVSASGFVGQDTVPSSVYIGASAPTLAEGLYMMCVLSGAPQTITCDLDDNGNDETYDIGSYKFLLLNYATTSANITDIDPDANTVGDIFKLSSANVTDLNDETTGYVPINGEAGSFAENMYVACVTDYNPSGAPPIYSNRWMIVSLNATIEQSREATDYDLNMNKFFISSATEQAAESWGTVTLSSSASEMYNQAIFKAGGTPTEWQLVPSLEGEIVVINYTNLSGSSDTSVTYINISGEWVPYASIATLFTVYGSFTDDYKDLSEGSDGHLYKQTVGKKNIIDPYVAKQLLRAAYTGNVDPLVKDTEFIYFPFVLCPYAPKDESVDSFGNVAFDSDIAYAAIGLCKDIRRDCIALCDIGDCDNSTHVIDTRQNHFTFNTYHAALYCNHSRVWIDEMGGDQWVSPIYHMSSVIPYSRSVAEIWAAPAGFRRALLPDVKELRFHPEEGDQDNLYRAQVNPLLRFRQGVVVFGQLTTQQRASAMQDINVVCNVLYIKRELREFCLNYTFEYNTPDTHDQIYTLIDEFLSSIQEAGGLVRYTLEVGATAYEYKRKIIHVNVILWPIKIIERINVNMFIRN